MPRKTSKRSTKRPAAKKTAKKTKGGALRFSESQILARLNDACAPFSYIDLARASGMSRETIRRQLIGMSAVSVELVCEVCRHLDLTSDWILFGKGRGPAKR